MSKNTVTESKIQKKDSYKALYDFFIALDPLKLVLLGTGMNGADTAVLCRVANAMINDSNMECALVNDDEADIDSAITRFIESKKPYFNPDRDYISILIIGLNDVNFGNIAKLSNPAHRIITTTLTFDAHDTTFDPYASRSVILPDGTCHICKCVAYWKTVFGSPLREINGFLQAYIKQFGFGYHEIAEASNKFTKTSIINDNGEPLFDTPFAKGRISNSSVVNADKHDAIQKLPLYALVRDNIAHVALYLWYIRTMDEMSYIYSMSERITNVELYGDKTFTRALRNAIVMDEYSKADDPEMKQHRELLQQYESRTPTEFEMRLERALQEEFGAFMNTTREIISKMRCINKCKTPFTTLGGLTFSVKTPNIVVYEGDPTEYIPHENSIMKTIAECVRIMSGKSESDTDCINTNHNVMIPRIDHEDPRNIDRPNLGEPINIIIKHDSVNNLIKVWTFGTPYMNVNEVSRILRRSLYTMSPKFISPTEPLTDIDGKVLTGLRLFGAVIDLAHPFGKKKRKRRV